MNVNLPTLAIYCIPDKSDFYFSDIIHDHNLSLFEAGKLQKYLHLERYTGKKYDNSLHKFLYPILKKLKLLNKPLDFVIVDSVIGRSCISYDGKFRFEAIFKDYLENDLEKAFGFALDKKVNTYVLNHELAHIYTNVVFFGEFRDNSLLVHFDGGASLSNFSVWLFKNGNLNLLDYSFNLKYLSSLFNANALNFFILGIKRPQHNAFPGKFMGFTSYGNVDFKILQWLIKNDFFADIWNDKKRFFASAKENFGWDKKNFSTKDKFLQDIAATVQYFFTSEFLKILNGYAKQTGAKFLYYSGGSALNIKTNTAIVNSKIFEDVFIPPVPNDAGLSLGAAAFLELRKGNKLPVLTPYINNFDLDCSPVSENYNFSLIEKVAKALVENKIIGVFRDCAEAGPRALGNRSILAIADNKNIAKKLSMKIKGREWYRPLAPVMLEKYAKFFTNLEQIHHLSKFMLLDFDIDKSKIKFLKGATHIDNTARIQTIFSREQNPFLFDLLNYLDKKYSVFALINTSFNGKGEPIVHTQEQALQTARKIGIDALVLQDDFIDFS